MFAPDKDVNELSPYSYRRLPVISPIVFALLAYKLFFLHVFLTHTPNNIFKSNTKNGNRSLIAHGNIEFIASRFDEKNFQSCIRILVVFLIWFMFI